MKRIISIIAISFISVIALQSQTREQLSKLLTFSEEKASYYKENKARTIARAKELNIPIRYSDSVGKGYHLLYFENDKPIYFTTNNLNASATISTNYIHPSGGSGLNLTGSSEVLGIWDEAAVRTEHQEFDSRVTYEDGVVDFYSNHSTHVAGTLIGNGTETNARGMSFEGILLSYDWESDVSEMATEAASGLLISNHSYGAVIGWYKDWLNNWEWAGSESISDQEDYKFGFYNERAEDYDEIANNAPYYLICKSAGNDQDEGPWFFPAYPKDGGDDGFDCLPPVSVAKNVITIGAVKDIETGYISSDDVELEDYSSCGPADDGRIKPDLVANGEDVFSAIARDGSYYSNDSYDLMSGTSMACPTIAGSVALLNEHQRSLFGDAVFRSSTIKGLLIHTAREAGDHAGPDYRFGWGLANFAAAAELIDETFLHCINISEYELHNSEVLSIPIDKDAIEDLKITICWNDPAGTPPSASLDPIDKMLVNDLDLRVIGNNVTYYPWKLNPNSPSNAASNGDNNTDNVEQVIVNSNYGGLYEIQISHKGSLIDNSQIVSVIISGAEEILDVKEIGTNYGGYFTLMDQVFWAHDQIIAEDVYIGNNSEVIFMSGNSITFGPGFELTTGSTMKAIISEMLSCSQNPITAKKGSSNKNYPKNIVFERNIIPRASIQKDYSKNIESSGVLNHQIVVYPNPVSDNLHITVNSNEIYKVEMFNTLGQISYSAISEPGTNVINMTDYAKGLYILRMKRGNEVLNTKIIVE